MPGNIDKLFGVHEQAVVLRSRRAEILASNMANADTPNYKARDIDFKGALGQAKNNLAARMTQTQANHLPGINETSTGTQAKYRIPLQASLDGNTVESQIEQGKFAENAVHYQASLEFLNRKIAGIIGALKGE